MIVAIHQPNFIPWIGYFYKIFNVDIFVLLDDVQYTKNSFINRNKIKTQDGEKWLSIPVHQSGRFGQLINQVEIVNNEKSFKKLKSSIRTNYAKAKYFSEVFDIIDPLMDKQNNLSILNEILIRGFIKYLNIDTEIILASSLKGVSGKSTDRLVSICEVLGASVYVSGFGSKNYQTNQKFKSKGIDCEVYNFQHPIYPQLWGAFIPNLSIIDLLFNVGSNAITLIKNID